MFCYINRFSVLRVRRDTNALVYFNNPASNKWFRGAVDGQSAFHLELLVIEVYVAGEDIKRDSHAYAAKSSAVTF